MGKLFIYMAHNFQINESGVLAAEIMPILMTD
jgi:hypothetical protein